MKTIPLISVSIPERRYRKHFDEDAIRELAESIESVGLLHLPILQGGTTLVSGERRFRAISLLHEEGRSACYLDIPIPAGELPYAAFEELDDLAAKQVELEENTARRDLTWQERVQAVAEFHRLKRELNPSHTIQDTTKELRGETNPQRVQVIKDQIVIANNLHDKDIRRAPSLAAAQKILRRKAEDEINAMVRKKIVAPETRHTLYFGDAVEWMSGLDGGQIDVILTDPPYGQRADLNVANDIQDHEYQDSEEYSNTLIAEMARLGLHVTKSDAHLYMFCNILRFPSLRDLIESAGWTVWPRPLIWYKKEGHIPDVYKGPRYTYEAILYAIKGNRPVLRRRDDVVVCSAVSERRHAAEKPVALYVDLLERSCHSGDLVLDPFVGSGTIYPAANALGLTALGAENSEKYFNIAKTRLAEEPKDEIDEIIDEFGKSNT